MPPRPSTQPAHPVHPQQVPASRNTPSTVGDDDTADCIVVKEPAKSAMPYSKRTRKPSQKAVEAEASAAAAAATTPVPISDSDSDAGRTRARRAAAASSSRTTPGNKRALNQADFPPTQPPAAKRLTTTTTAPHPANATTTTGFTSSSSFSPINSPGYQGQNTLARFEAIQEDLPTPPQQATAEIENYQRQLNEAAKKNEETTELLKFTRESNADLTTRLKEAQTQLRQAQQQVATLTQANQILNTRASLADDLGQQNQALQTERDQLATQVTNKQGQVNQLLLQVKDLQHKLLAIHLKQELEEQQQLEAQQQQNAPPTGTVQELDTDESDLDEQERDEQARAHIPPDDDIVNVRNERDALLEEYHAEVNKVARSEAKVTELNAQITALQSQGTTLETQNTTLQDQITTLKTQNLELQTQLKQHQIESAEKIRLTEERHEKEYDELEARATSCIDKMMGHAQKIRDGPPEVEKAQEAQGIVEIED